jgi:hypothetical protein
MKLTLWIPAAESPRWPCVDSWMRMDNGGCELTYVRSKANNPKYSWNKVCDDFLKTDGDWLFSCHNDVCFDPETLPRLMSWDKKLINALIFMRNGPTLPHIWKSYDERKIYAMRIKDTRDFFYRHPEAYKWGPQVIEPRPDDALAEIDFTSTSCTLIHREVLEAMKPLVGIVPGTELPMWFVMDNDFTGGGEDRRFFEKAREAGYPAYVDRSCVAGHLAGDTPMGVMDFLVYESNSDFLGTGEADEFNLNKIQWKMGEQGLPGVPVDLFNEAMGKLERKEVPIGEGKWDSGIVPLNALHEEGFAQKQTFQEKVDDSSK